MKKLKFSAKPTKDWIAKRELAARNLDAFLTRNYDFHHTQVCDDPECSGNFYESESIIHDIFMTIYGDDPYYETVELSMEQEAALDAVLNKKEPNDKENTDNRE